MGFAKGNTLSKGRPPAGRALSEGLRMFLARPNGQDKSKRTYRECMIEKLVGAAIAGEIAAIKEIFDRTEGKPPQIVQGEGTKISVTLNWGSSPQWLPTTTGSGSTIIDVDASEVPKLES